MTTEAGGGDLLSEKVHADWVAQDAVGQLEDEPWWGRVGARGVEAWRRLSAARWRRRMLRRWHYFAPQFRMYDQLETLGVIGNAEQHATLMVLGDRAHTISARMRMLHRLNPDGREEIQAEDRSAMPDLAEVLDRLAARYRPETSARFLFEAIEGLGCCPYAWLVAGRPLVIVLGALLNFDERNPADA